MAKAKKGKIPPPRSSGKSPKQKTGTPSVTRKTSSPIKNGTLLRYFTAQNLLLILALLILVGIAYSNSFQTSFHFDDFNIIVNNTDIHDLSDLRSILASNFFRPVLYITFALNHHFGSADPFGYHLVNFILHLLNMALVFFIIHRLISFIGTRASKEESCAWRKHDPYLPAFLGTTIFALHPLQTESVTYIASRSSVLSTFFVLGTVSAFIIARLVPADSRSPLRSRILWLSLSTASFLLGVATKELGACAPFLLLVLEFVIFSAQRFRDFFRNLIRFHLPFLFIILLGLGFRLAFMVQLQNPAEFRSPWHNLLTQFGVIGRYLGLLILPVNQNVDPDIPLQESVFGFAVLLPLGLIVGLLALGWWLKKREPLAAAGIFWWFIALLPTSSIVPLLDLMAEHRVYLPLVGAAMTLGLIPAMLSQSPSKTVKPTIVAMIVLGLAMTIMTYQRNKIWLSELTLWEDAAANSPDKGRPLMHYANTLFSAGRIQEALVLYEKVLEENSKNMTVRYNMGIIHKRLGRPDLAVKEWMQVARETPGHPNVHVNLGNYYMAQGDLNKARMHYQSEIRRNYRNPLGYYNLGKYFQKTGQREEAIDRYETALRYKPDFEPCLLSLGALYYDLGRYQEAKTQFTTLLRFNPNNAKAHFNLGNVYMKENQVPDALREYDLSARMDTSFPDPLINMGMIHYRQLKQPDKARILLEQALIRGPKHPRAPQIRQILSQLNPK